MENKKQTKYVNYTPVGTLNYPKLNKPDEFKGNKSFQTEIILDPANQEVIDFMERLEIHVLSKLKKGDFRPIKNVDGKIVIKVKRRAEFEQPSFYVPKADGSCGYDKLEKAPGLIWSGTKAGVGFTTYEYDGGVSFNLVSVAIHDLVQPNSKEETKAPATKKRSVDFS